MGRIVVYEDKESQQKIAVKALKRLTNYNSVANEAELLLSLSHPRILSAIKFQPSFLVDLPKACKITEKMIIDSSYCPAIFLEYAPNGDLADLIKTVGHFPEVIARTYFRQLIDALEYLHGKNICHLDIKPDNILLDANYCVKLADFGFALKIPQNSLLTSIAGSPSYLLPEMHLKQPYDGFQADLFALGVTLFALYSGKMPFAAAKSDDRHYQFFWQDRHEEFWKHHEKLKKQPKQFYSKDFRDLIEQMLAPDGKRRLTIQEIKMHPWYRGLSLTDEELAKLTNTVVYQYKAMDMSMAKPICSIYTG